MHAASDLFLHEGRPPQIRLNGQLMEFGEHLVTAGDIEGLWRHCGAGEEALDRDTTYVASDGGRFRVSLFRYLGQRGAVLRHIKAQIPDFETLGLPEQIISSWIARPSGIIIVSGRTGSGKSTTMAAALDWLNRRHTRHVVTIEDPIEYLFQPQLCLFTQREVGIDPESFAAGLRHALRQSPDVVFVGETRDMLSAQTALQAAETGHLVLTTLHSSTVPETIERFVQLFASADREGAQRVLASQLVGILCQRLIPAESGRLIPAIEMMQNGGVTRKLIQEGRFVEMGDHLARGDHDVNVNFLTSFARLTRAGLISQETALQLSDNPHEMTRVLRGISGASVARPRS